MPVTLVKKAINTEYNLNEGDQCDALVQEKSDRFRNDVLDGLNADEKFLSPKYFYDRRGSQYFDEICVLSEYYPYRTELALLPDVVHDMSDMYSNPVSVVEFGAGSLVKIRSLLEEIDLISEYIPIDISGDHLQRSCQSLQKEFPRIAMKPMVGDFSHKMQLHAFDGDRLGFFPGSTIGNFAPQQAQDFLSAAKQTLQTSSGTASILVGVDTKKSPKLLHAAYNDESDVTAKFNLNILHRINRELGANIEIHNFEHYAFYNASKGRVEMHLISQQDQRCDIDDQRVEFQRGESIHTECSYKYTPKEFELLANASGWQVSKYWMADEDMFSMFLLTDI